MKFIESLPENVLNEVKMDYCTRIEQSKLYTPEEVAEFMLDLPNQYIGDMQVALDPMLFDYITALSNGTELKDLPPLYKIIDEQDESNFHFTTFREAKEWLQDFWSFNPDEDMSDDEHDEWIEIIGKTTSLNEFHDMLQGIGYYMEEAF